ncbi:MAG: esterase-like activity of phytase family protein [Kiritimatiellae bacterium]|nr:esterase-like activity of phytase family protein [Kiritimatiellia bacterium]
MSLHSNALHVIVAATAVGLPAACAALSITKISEAYRPSSAGAEQISGITWAGGDLYYAVDDNDKKLYPLTLGINGDGELASTNITIGIGVLVQSASDMEGCAWDPASRMIWVSDETGPTIRKINPETGATSGSVAVPTIHKQYYGNFSLEALTISGDGLTMWTANEEALKCDGEKSSKTEGSVVRLTRFSRKTVSDEWVAAGQWAYLTQPVGSDPWVYNNDTKTRSGVAGMVALPDGRLLVLERNLWGDNFLDASFYSRIYLVDGTTESGDKATDVSGIPSLKNAEYKRVKKTVLFDKEVGWVNYEGICLGPRLNDGSLVLVLVSDAGNCTAKIMTMKLEGLGDVRDVDVMLRDAGGTRQIGGPYRYKDGSTAEFTLEGAAYGSGYVVNENIVTNTTWIAGSKNGEGTNAKFSVFENAALTWNVSDVFIASTPIDDAESFENYAPGAQIAYGEVGRWTGTGEVVAAAYMPPNPPGSPMPKDAHTKVLEVEDAAIRSFSCTTNGNDRLDMMIAVVRCSADETPVEAKDGEKVVIICDVDGKLKLLCRDANGEAVWATLSETVYKNGDWVRLSVSLDSTTKPGETYALVRVNGEACMTSFGVRSPLDPTAYGAWHRTLGNSEGGKIAVLDLRGSVKVDDVIKTTEEFETELSAETTQIDGVSVAWLKAQGLGLNPQKPIPAPKLRSLGYLLADAYDAGLDPAVDEPFAITGIRVLDDGRLELSFNGVREDLGKDARDALYPVYRAETIGGNESRVAGTTAIVVDGGVKRTVWTSNAPIDETQGFYRVKGQSKHQQ